MSKKNGEKNGDTLFIEDGYTRDGYIAAMPGIHPSLNFKFRPMLTQERSRLLQAASLRTDTGEQDEVNAKTIIDHIVSWDAGQKCTAELLLKLQPAISTKLVNIIAGYQASDPRDLDDKPKTMVETEAAKN